MTELSPKQIDRSMNIWSKGNPHLDSILEEGQLLRVPGVPFTEPEEPKIEIIKTGGEIAMDNASSWFDADLFLPLKNIRVVAPYRFYYYNNNNSNGKNKALIIDDEEIIRGLVNSSKDNILYDGYQFNDIDLIGKTTDMRVTNKKTNNNKQRRRRRRKRY